jgi:hypothetical protein
MRALTASSSAADGGRAGLVPTRRNVESRVLAPRSALLDPTDVSGAPPTAAAGPPAGPATPADALPVAAAGRPDIVEVRPSTRSAAPGVVVGMDGARAAAGAAAAAAAAVSLPADVEEDEDAAAAPAAAADTLDALGPTTKLAEERAPAASPRPSMLVAVLLLLLLLPRLPPAPALLALALPVTARGMSVDGRRPTVMREGVPAGDAAPASLPPSGSHSAGKRDTRSGA